MTDTLFPGAVDSALVQDSNYRFDGADRQYIDKQIIAIEEYCLTLSAPGGSVGQVQWHTTSSGKDVFGGTAQLTIYDGSGNILHSGTPVHKEGYAEFEYSSETSRARSQWSVGNTTNASSTAILTLSVPAATFSDCAIFVSLRTSAAYSSSGIKCATYAFEASFKRESGTLTRIQLDDITPISLGSGTAPGGLDIAVYDNDTIKVNATGIAATNIKWVTSIHVQVVKP